jgi:hypothetical protein
VKASGTCNRSSFIPPFKPISLTNMVETVPPIRRSQTRPVLPRRNSSLSAFSLLRFLSFRRKLRESDRTGIW